MAIAAANASKGRGNASSQATTGVTTAVSGSTFVVGVAWSNAAAFTSIADSKGNTYTQLGNEVSFSSGGGKARLYYCQNGVGGATHTATVTIGSVQDISVFFVEITGGALSGILDQNSTGASDVASPFTSQSITNTNAADLMVSLFASNSGSNPATHAESTGFTIQAGADETNGASFWTGCLATRIVAATGTYNSSFTESGGTSTAVFIASFKEMAAAAGGARLSRFTPGKLVRPGRGHFRVATRAFTEVTASGDMVGASTITFAASGVLTGTGALVGASTLTFAPSGTIQGFAPITGATTLTFSPSGTLAGTGALVGAATLTFSPSATLTGNGALVGATTLTFAPSATLTGTGALTGQATITFSPTGTLSDASGSSGAMTGSTAITFTAVGILTGTGDLQGSTTLTFAPTGILTDSNAPVVIDQPSGGFFYEYELLALRRKRRKREEEEAREEAEQIQAELDRNIALLLRVQEAKDAERADLKRLQDLADKYAGTRQPVTRRVSAVLLKAQEERTRNSLEQLHREVERMFTEEEISLMLILNSD